VVAKLGPVRTLREYTDLLGVLALQVVREPSLLLCRQSLPRIGFLRARLVDLAAVLLLFLERCLLALLRGL